MTSLREETTMDTHRFLLISALLTLVVPIPGASAQTAPEDELVWPLPPEAPRIRYAGVLYSEADLGKKSSFLGRLTGALVGTTDRFMAIQRPHDVWTDAEGRMFVTNGLQSGFWVFDPLEKEGRTIFPSGPAVVGKPMGIVGDGAGALFIADASGKRVVAMTPEGEFIKAYGGPDVLLNPTDVALSPEGDRIYVSDPYLHQVVIFDREGGDVIRRIGRDDGDLSRKRGTPRSATLLHSLDGAGDPDTDESSEATAPGHGASEPVEPSDLWENRGGELGHFRYPAFLATAPDGTLYVSDGMNFRVQSFDRDGEFITAFGRMGDVPGAFTRPKGVSVDSKGHVYVVDGSFNNVQVFDSDGNLLIVFGEFGNGNGQLWLPTGVAIDSDDQIFVADRYNNRIQIFQYLDAPAVPLVAPAPPARP